MAATMHRLHCTSFESPNKKFPNVDLFTIRRHLQENLIDFHGQVHSFKQLGSLESTLKEKVQMLARSETERNWTWLVVPETKAFAINYEARSMHSILTELSGASLSGRPSSLIFSCKPVHVRRSPDFEAEAQTMNFRV